MHKLATDHRLKGLELKPEDFIRKKAYEEVQVAILKSLSSDEERDKVNLGFIPAYLQN
jgi:hypothetical protein